VFQTLAGGVKPIKEDAVRTLLTLLALLLSLQPALALDSAEALERVSRAYAVGQPGLQNYQATVTSEPLRQLLNVASLSHLDALLASQPPIHKYWARGAAAPAFLAEGQNPPAPLRAAAAHLDEVFGLDLQRLFLPADRANLRAALLARAEVITTENRLGEQLLLSASLGFAVPVDLDGAFFSGRLGLPQQQVRRLVIDLDLDREVVRRLEVDTADGRILTMEVRHHEARGGHLPQELILTAPDGSVDDRFQTLFKQVDGYWLPDQQTRSRHHGAEVQSETVSFPDYRLNVALPDKVRRLLQLP
jgi:hypothetical protein